MFAACMPVLMIAIIKAGVPVQPQLGKWPQMSEASMNCGVPLIDVDSRMLSDNSAERAPSEPNQYSAVTCIVASRLLLNSSPGWGCLHPGFFNFWDCSEQEELQRGGCFAPISLPSKIAGEVDHTPYRNRPMAPRGRTLDRTSSPTKKVPRQKRASLSTKRTFFVRRRDSEKALSVEPTVTGPDERARDHAGIA